MEKVKVKITNMLDNRVTVKVPDRNFLRAWAGQGSSMTIEKEIVEELMYDTGFRNMITMGILYIEDLEVKKELGLEPEDATKPVNLIRLTNAEKLKYLSVDSIEKFKEDVSKLSKVQLEGLCDFAIDKKIINYEKSKILKELCGRDIIQAVRLKEQNEED